MKRFWSVTLLVAMLIAVLLPASAVLAQDGPAFMEGTVVADVLAIRAEASLGSEVLATVDSGMVVDVWSVDGSWAMVSYEDVVGYTFASDLDISLKFVGLDGEVVSDVLAVRSDQNITAEVLDTVDGGETVGVVYVDDLWAYVFTGHAIGWTFAEDLALGEDLSVASNFLQDVAEVSADVAAIRAEPNISSDVVVTVDNGETVSVLYQSDNHLWSYVWYDGHEGWAFAADLNVIAPRAYGEGTSNVLRLNFRSSPDTSDNDNIATQLPEAATVLLLGQTEDGTWLNVRYNGDDGWVSAEFIDTEFDTSTLPVTG